MKKKIWILILIVVLVLSVVLVGCKEKPEVFELETPLDDSVGFLRGTDITTSLNANPDRGFRYALALTLDSGRWQEARSYPNSDVTGYAMYNNEKKRLEGNAVSTAQVTVYLSNFTTTEIPKVALEQLYSYLNNLKKGGVRVLLKFAYEYDATNLVGAEDSIILNHIAQIKAWLGGNKSFVNQTILAYQGGFIGLDGNWGESQHAHDKTKIIDAIVEMLPDGKYLQVNSYDVKKYASRTLKFNRIGYSDENITGKYSANTVVDGKSKKEIKDMKAQSLYTLNDGGLPAVVDGMVIDELEFIKAMYTQKLSTLNIARNFIENGNEYILKKFEKRMITNEDLDKINVPYNPYWFMDGAGNSIARSAFDFVKDHLGYQMVASNFAINVKEETSGDLKFKKGSFSFTVTNFGMASPYSLDSIQLYFRNPATGAIKTDVKWLTGKFEADKLKSYGQIKIELPDVAYNSGWQIGIKIFTSANKSYTVRLANDIPYIDGVNYIYQD